METLLLEPTPTAQWHALVEEAEYSSSIKLQEEIESYLVFLLMRFVDQPEMVQSILATDFLKSLGQLPKERLETLRDVGDKCLLFAGLFPGRARKRRVRISYYVRLGQMAYESLSSSSLSESQYSQFKSLYSDLSQQFVNLMDILHSMRAVVHKTSNVIYLKQ